MANIADASTVEGMLIHQGWSPNLTVQALANSTLTMTAASTTQQVFTGSTAGQIIKLPDATTLQAGARYDLYNTSTTVTAALQDGNGGALVTIPTTSVVRCVLQTAGTVAGTWIFAGLETGTFAGLINYNVISSTAFTTSSTTDTLITSFTVTPQSGTYAIWYNSSILIGTNNAIASCTIYNNGSAITDSTRSTTGTGTSVTIQASTQTIAQFNGTGACDVRVKVSSSRLTVNQRSLILLRIGN